MAAPGSTLSELSQKVWSEGHHVSPRPHPEGTGRLQQGSQGRLPRENSDDAAGVRILSLVAFTKNDGGKSWDRCPLTHRIPNNILDSNFATTTDFGFDIFSDPMTEEETNHS